MLQPETPKPINQGTKNNVKTRRSLMLVMTEENANKPNKCFNGRIYIIRNCLDDDTYIGSTTQQLSKRFYDHKVNSQDTNKKCPLYNKIRELGQDKFYIELIEKYPCETKEELRRREGELIREKATLNKIVAGRNRREYVDDNKERINKYQREYKQKNAEEIKERMYHYNKQYRKINGERLRTQQRAFKQNNPERYKELKQKYRDEHREEINERSKQKRECPKCGCWIRKGGMFKHQQTPKCKSLQNQLEAKGHNIADDIENNGQN